MAKTLQFRRYTTSNLSSITGASGELIVDTTLNAITVHTGSNPGGFYTANAIVLQATSTQANSAYTRANNSINANTGGTITGDLTVTGNLIISNTATFNGTLTPTLSANGNTSSYATKHFVEYNPVSKALTYSSTPDASSPYITGYSAEVHVSPVALNDSGRGTIGDPVKTIARAQVLAALAFETTGAGFRKTIVLHPGDYVENVTINTQFTVLTTHELIGKNTTLTGTLTITKGCTIDGLKMTNLIISADNTTGTVDLIGCTVTTAVTKTSSAYTVFRGCDLSSSTLSITGTGSVVMVGGNYFTVTVNNAAAGVLAKAVISMGPVTLTAGTLQLSDTLIYSATNTSNAITQSAGSVLTLNNSQTLIPDLSNVSRISLNGFYSILSAVYDKPNSILATLSATGGSLSSIIYDQYINADRLILSTGGQITFPDATTQTTAWPSSSGTKASSATGTLGQISWDANYIYVCTATNTWKRSPLTGAY
jgi:hypothetical protein